MHRTEPSEELIPLFLPFESVLIDTAPNPSTAHCKTGPQSLGTEGGSEESDFVKLAK